MFLQFGKQVVVTGCQVRTIRWMGNDVPAKFLQKSDGRMGVVGATVVILCLFEFLRLRQRGMPPLTDILYVHTVLLNGDEFRLVYRLLHSKTK